MISWENIDNKKPKVDEIVLIYCPELQFPCEIMRYKGPAVIDKGDRSLLVGDDVFTGKGFLTDDITHWARLEKPKMFKPIDSIDLNEVNDIELKEPIIANIYQEDDETYRAEFGNMVYGIGDSIDEAIEMLKREIYTLKHDLNVRDDNILPQFIDMRDWLNEMIRED